MRHGVFRYGPTTRQFLVITVVFAGTLAASCSSVVEKRHSDVVITSAEADTGTTDETNRGSDANPKATQPESDAADGEANERAIDVRDGESDIDSEAGQPESDAADGKANERAIDVRDSESDIDSEAGIDAGDETDSALATDLDADRFALGDSGSDASDQECRDEDNDGFYVGCDDFNQNPGPDCDDADNQRFPGALELCDGVDNDCDPLTPIEGESDVDGDGFRACAECDDTDPLIFPEAIELCDGVDSDCDPETPVDGEWDNDEDGVLACADCDDGDAQRFPGNPEICDGIDNDCDNTPDESDEDVAGTGDDCDAADADLCRNGKVVCGDEQSDGNHELYCYGDANIVEVCDAVDNDCDGETDEQLSFPCFGFFIFADSQLIGSNSYLQTSIDQMALIDSNAVAGICVGDLTNNATDAQWALHDGYIDQMFSRAATDFEGEDPRYLGVLGNHDTYTSGWSARWTDHLPGQNALSPGDPSVGVYYSLTYENVLIVVMDSEHAGDAESSWQSEQTEALALALTESTAEFKFVFFHRPVYSCSSIHQGELAAGLPWVDLAENNGVDIIFNGHTHVYTRSHPLLKGQRTANGDGVIQLEVGTVGHTPRSVDVSSYTITGTDAAGDARSDTYNCSTDADTGNLVTTKLSSRTFCHVRINDCQATFECYVVGPGNETPFDTWIIDHCS